jgi:hypothetical protein
MPNNNPAFPPGYDVPNLDTWAPRNTGKAVQVADQAFPLPPDGGLPQEAGAEPTVFPTPEEVIVGEPVFSPPPQTYLYPSQLPPVQVADQPPQAPGTGFTPPSEFTVVGPSTSFQTNLTADQVVTCTVTGVLDADTLQPPTPDTTRFYVSVAVPPKLNSYPVSLLGRLINFTSLVATEVNVSSYTVQPTDTRLDDDYTATGASSINLPAISSVPVGRSIFVVDTGGQAGSNNITVVPSGSDKINGQNANYVIKTSGSGTWFVANAGNWQVGTPDSSNLGAARAIQNFGANFVVIAVTDESPSNGDVEVLGPVYPGDQFSVPVNRQGSEQVNTPGTSVDVNISTTTQPTNAKNVYV